MKNYLITIAVAMLSTTASAQAPMVLGDNHAKLLIADREVFAASGLETEGAAVNVEGRSVPVLYTDELALPAPDVSPRTSDISADRLALLIYTSGSRAA